MRRMSNFDTRFPVHTKVAEPLLSFHPERTDYVERHPLVGLLQYGPYSGSLIHGVINPIRVAVICPSGRKGDILRLVEELDYAHTPKERREYLKHFPGFSRTFRVGLKVEEELCIELSPDLDRQMDGSRKPHLLLSEAISKALGQLRAKLNAFDVALILLPNTWSFAFRDMEGDGFDLHDYIKATAATWGIATQVLNDDPGGALKYYCRCSVAWRLGLALYAKAGGVPWKMAGTEPGVAYIGISYALRTVNERKVFVTCCSQVFDSDGAGLDFVAYETPNAEIVRGNPFLGKDDMYRVMARSLALYQRRHLGRSPQRVVVHKSTEFKKAEIDGCFDAWRNTEFELIQVQQDSIWRGIDIDPPKADQNTKKGDPARYPCDRGLVLPLSEREALVWTQGNASETVGGRDYFKEGKGIPSPLMLRLFAGHTDWEHSARTILGLSKMNWNNDGLYDRLPVTMSYAKVLAEVIGCMPKIDKQTFQMRFFM
jgi:hypothetical protein